MEIVLAMFRTDTHRSYLVVLVRQFIAEKEEARTKRKKQEGSKGFLKIRVLRAMKKGSRDLLV